MASLTDMAKVAVRNFSPIDRQSSISRFWVSAAYEPSGTKSVVCQPIICQVLQGAKRTLVGDQVLNYSAGEFLLVGAEVPAMWEIIEASQDVPFVSANIMIDTAVVSSVLLDERRAFETMAPAGFAIGIADPWMLDAWRRLIDILDRPDEIHVLAPLLEYEIVFRLLRSPLGPILRQMAAAGSRLSQIRRSMAWIRQQYTETLRAEEMAAEAGMSLSVFHRHFKSVAGTSPLGYQKQIRLHEARRQMLAGVENITGIAFAVGYESPSQFSREYKRLFGMSPSMDAIRLQRSVA